MGTSRNELLIALDRSGTTWRETREHCAWRLQDQCRFPQAAYLGQCRDELVLPAGKGLGYQLLLFSSWPVAPPHPADGRASLGSAAGDAPCRASREGAVGHLKGSDQHWTPLRFAGWRIGDLSCCMANEWQRSCAGSLLPPQSGLCTGFKNTQRRSRNRASAILGKRSYVFDNYTMSQPHFGQLHLTREPASCVGRGLTKTANTARERTCDAFTSSGMSGSMPMWHEHCGNCNASPPAWAQARQDDRFPAPLGTFMQCGKDRTDRLPRGSMVGFVACSCKGTSWGRIPADS